MQISRDIRTIYVRKLFNESFNIHRMSETQVKGGITGNKSCAIWLLIQIKIIRFLGTFDVK